MKKKTNKFNKGDKVVLINDTGVGAKIGSTATVREYSYAPGGTSYLNVVWDRKNKLCGDQSDGGYYESAFKLLYKEWDEEENI